MLIPQLQRLITTCLASNTIMAENVPTIASKSIVQEIAAKGNDVPEEYLYKDGYPKAIDASDDLWRNDLLIDFSLLSSSSELEKLRSALSQWGCFQVINHGIESSFLEELIEVSKQFFALPLEEKLKCSAEDDNIQGYDSDSLIFGTHTQSWNDRLLLYFYPKEKLRLQCWPPKPENFSAMIKEYSEKIATTNTVICKAMARSLNLEENSFKTGKQGPRTTRVNFIPSCPCPERVLGVRPHSDSSTITYLLPDNEIEGLQILKDDQWYKVLVIPGALFINFGELGEAMTNGVFKSVVHRVVTNTANDRISVAMFFSPDDEEIKPLSGLVSANQIQLYRKFNREEYMQKIFESFRLGLRAIDSFRV